MQAGAACHARTWVAGASAPISSLAPKGLGQGGSSTSQSRLAVGHDQGLGGAERGLGVSGFGDRLLHPRDRGLGLESALSLGRSSGGAQPRRAGGFAFRFSWNGFDFDDRQRHPVYVSPLCRNPEPVGHHAPSHRLQSSRGQQLYRALPSQLKRRGGAGSTNTRTSPRPSRASPAGSRSTITTVRIADSGRTPHESRAQFLAQTLTSNPAPCV